MKTLFALIILTMLHSSIAQAATIAELVGQLKGIESDPAALDSAVKAGKDRALLCAYCHGKDGNSVQGHIPNLAGQNAEYLLTQFQYFADGTRKDFVMSDLAKNLSNEERINIILFYSRNPVKAEISTDPALRERGEKIYQGFCHACHGVDGRGNAGLPRVSGQPRAYLVETLESFLSGDEKRKQSVMVGIIARYNHEDISALAEYLSSLK